MKLILKIIVLTLITVSYAQAEPQIISAQQIGVYNFTQPQQKPRKVEVKGSDIWVLQSGSAGGELLRFAFQADAGFALLERLNIGLWVEESIRDNLSQSAKSNTQKTLTPVSFSDPSTKIEILDFDIFREQLAVIVSQAKNMHVLMFTLGEQRKAGDIRNAKFLAYPVLPDNFQVNALTFNLKSELFLWSRLRPDFIKYAPPYEMAPASYAIAEKELPFKPEFAQVTTHEDEYYVVQTLASQVSILKFENGQPSQKKIAEFGVRPGQVIFPKGLALFADQSLVLIADSLLGAIQAINPEDLDSPLILGDPKTGTILHIKHPTSIASLETEKVLLIIDPVVGKLMALTIDFSKSVKMSAQMNILKANELVEPGIHAPCNQCHDGSIVNSLYIFQDDKTQHHFEVEKELEEKISKTFPPREGKLVCTSCHSHHAPTAEKKFLKDSKAGEPVICARCHEQIANSEADVAHPVLGIVQNKVILSQMIMSGMSNSANIDCKSCHNIHNPGDLNSNLLGFSTPALCLKCHQDKMPQKIIGHPLEGDAAVTKEKKPQCSQCHSIHKESNKSNLAQQNHPGDAGVVKKSECLDCHKAQKGMKNTAHQGIWAKLVSENKISTENNHNFNQKNDCALCHQMHGSDRPYILSREILDSKIVKKDPTAVLCLSCHKDEDAKTQEKRYFSHPGNLIFNNTREGAKSIALVNEKFLPYTDQDKVGFLTCTSCHDPHLGRDQGELMLRDFEEIVPFCSKCHGAEGLTKYKYFHTQRYRK